jgi:transcriptional regulator with XRE-family HTH domain
MTTETQSAFAARLGVSRQYISQLKTAGRLVMDASGHGVDVEASMARIEATESLEPMHQARKAGREHEREYHGKGVNDISPPGATSQAHGAIESLPPIEKLGAAHKFEAYKGQKLKNEQIAIEIDRAAGALVERAKVDFVVSDIAATLRVLCENGPDRYAPVIHPLQTFEETHAALTDAFSDLLSELDAHIAKRLPELDA